MREKIRILILPALACLVGVSVVQAEFEERAAISADKLVLHDLIGEVRVEGHGGSAFEVVVHVRGADASPGRVSIETDEGSTTELSVRFPLDESKRYVYPRLKGGNVSFDLDAGGSWLAKLFGRGRIKVSGRGSGLEIWADVTIRAPRGGSVVVDHGVGTVEAHDVEADVELSTRSGAVEVQGATGAVSIDTGSGRVTVVNVDGAVSVDTGSGGVSVSGVEAEKVWVDTGSGRVELDRVVSSTLYVDTGSGGVRARGISADEVTIDTGSGSVELQLERMGHGRFEIDTGSGSIDLRLPPDASAEVSADTGSGGVRLDLAGDHRVRRQEADEAELIIGGGAARLILDTGSGAIRISQ